MSHEQHQHPFSAKNHHHHEMNARDDKHKNDMPNPTPISANILRLQRTIGNQAVMRLMNKPNRANAEPAIQRRKVFNEDVEIKGELFAKEIDANEINSRQFGGDKALIDVVKASDIRQNGKQVRTEDS